MCCGLCALLSVTTWHWLGLKCTALLLQMLKQCIVCAGSVYHGEAINPRYLSFFERYVLRYGKHYNPAKEMEIRKAEFAVVE